MRTVLLALIGLSTAALGAEAADRLVTKVAAEKDYVALILGEGGQSPLLTASYRCVPHSDRFYAREYDDDREGMAGETPDRFWTSRGYRRADCDSVCAADAAPFHNRNDWAWRKTLDKKALLAELNGLTSARVAAHASRASMAERRQAIAEFRRLCGV
jgi:hypothetical protein